MTIVPQITSFLLVQGIDTRATRGSVGGKLLDVTANPKVLNFGALNNHDAWGVYGAGVGWDGKRRIWYPIAIVTMLPMTPSFNFYTKFNCEERNFKVDYGMIMGAMRFYLGQMFAAGEFRSANTTARIRVKPFVKTLIGFDLPVGIA